MIGYWPVTLFVLWMGTMVVAVSNHHNLRSCPVFYWDAKRRYKQTLNTRPGSQGQNHRAEIFSCRIAHDSWFEPSVGSTGFVSHVTQRPARANGGQQKLPMSVRPELARKLSCMVRRG